MSRREHKVEIPDIVRDKKTGLEYKKGKFLGRGGFATCYELIDTTTNVVWAGKVIAKAQLVKKEQLDKMVQEIEIHKSVNHPHIVEFKSNFEDDKNIYIILEICNKRSLMEMHKRRKTLTEPEIRYFIRQIAEACLYLHKNGIIHRDLKLGNLFLNDTMQLKVGDFGLATRMEKPGERKMTLCGTPNYISPEVLTKKGHSFEVDVWSLGCIVYTLAVGKPPFETQELKETYRRIKNCQYSLEKVPNDRLREFIKSMLQIDPKNRPTMLQILQDPYLSHPNYVPRNIPVSCLTVAPRFDQRLSILPTPPSPLQEINGNLVRASENKPATTEKPQPAPKATEVTKPASRLPNKPAGDVVPSPKPPKPRPVEEPNQGFYIKELYKQLRDLVQSKPSERRVINMDDAEDPALAPFYWVSKWVDYTDKYGLGYSLNDDSVAVLFNDVTRIILLADQQRIQYIDRDGVESFHSIAQYPQDLYKKIALLKYFRNYMREHLVKMGDRQSQEAEDMARLPYLNNWFRTRHAICFHLTNGIVQINFFQDHTKLILCPLMSAVTYIDENREFRTYKFSALQEHGCTRDLSLRLSYATDVVQRLMNHRLTGTSRRAPLQNARQPQQPQALQSQPQKQVNGIAPRGGIGMK